MLVLSGCNNVVLVQNEDRWQVRVRVFVQKCPSTLFATMSVTFSIRLLRRLRRGRRSFFIILTLTSASVSVQNTTWSSKLSFRNPVLRLHLL